MINTQEGLVLITRVMRADEIIHVKEIARRCGSAHAEEPFGWFIVHPTIVAEYEEKIVGYTSYAMAMIPGHGEVLYGMDVCVDPQFHGRGIARGLHMARMAIARSVGARIFMGVTDDVRMSKILKSYGAHACVRTERGTLYVGEIPNV